MVMEGAGAARSAHGGEGRSVRKIQITKEFPWADRS